ncbi:MAG: excinuclease ABC subunit A, partial [Flavobacteriales bacterium]
MATILEVNPKENIIIKGAKLHNLKNIDVVIPRNKLVVITGLSGSGKSSLAFDTLYAEGQRRYVESLSSYARQFLGKLDKPKVDYIKGIAPAIAIEQKVNSTNPRSTVGTTTEIYDYLKLLYARIGKTISPISGQVVKKHTVTDVINHVRTYDEGAKLLLLAPIKVDEKRDSLKTLQLFSKQGYARILYNGEVIRVDAAPKNIGRDFYLVIDRIIVQDDEDFFNRLANAVDTAFFEGKGQCLIEALETKKQTVFSNNFELDGMSFLEPNVHLFSFNNPYGACTKCEGYGDVIGIDEALVIPNTALSVYENAIFPWRGESMGWYRDQLVNSAYLFDFPIHKPWFQLTEQQQQLVWRGNDHFVGLDKFFGMLEEKSYKIQNRVMLSRYRGKTKCSACKGKRLRKETDYVKVNEKSISDLVELSMEKLLHFFQLLDLNAHDRQIAARLLTEINTRLGFLNQVGLGYLTLNRKSNTLSGGESQRINLATSLGSSLVGSMYILDEPSIGLHPK